MDELKNLRKEIDDIDKELVENFEKRMEIVSKILQYKKENSIPIYDESREDEVIKNNLKYLKDKKFEEPLKKFFHNLMDISKEQQK